MSRRKFYPTNYRKVFVLRVRLYDPSSCIAVRIFTCSIPRKSHFSVRHREPTAVPAAVSLSWEVVEAGEVGNHEDLYAG